MMAAVAVVSIETPSRPIVWTEKHKYSHHCIGEGSEGRGKDESMMAAIAISNCNNNRDHGLQMVADNTPVYHK